MLIENDAASLRHAFETELWTDIIESERCLILLAETPNALGQFLSRYPQCAQGKIAVYNGAPDESDEWHTAVANALKAAAQRVEQQQALVLKQAKRLPPYPRSIRFFAPGHNMLQDACVKSMRGMGYDCERLKWKTPLYRFIRSTAWISALQNDAIDAAVLLNATPASFTHRPELGAAPLRRFTWFVDNPRRFVRDSNAFEGCDAVGVFDKAYLPFIQERCAAPAIELRTGYGVDPSLAVYDEAFAHDIAFVGELGARGFAAQEVLLSRINSELVRAINERIKELDLIEPLDLDQAMIDLFEEHGIEYAGAWVEFAENKATAGRRRFLLEGLRAEGVTIYGDADWGMREFAGPMVDHYAGSRIDYAHELPRLYASSKINVNIFHVQCQTAPNPRVYDVLACCGFLLSSYNPGLEDEFEIGADLDVFHSRDELKDKAAFYLAHPSERERIARNGQVRALAKCGYGDKIQRLLRALRTMKSGDSYVSIRG